MNTIQTTGVQSPEAAPCIVEVDEWVPLRFRTYVKPLGANYYRMGNHSTKLLELIVEPSSCVLRGMTLTLFDSFGPWPNLEVVNTLKGLPVVSQRADQRNYVDVDRDFFVSLRNDELLVFWGEFTQTVSASTLGTVEFLFAKTELLAARFFALSPKQVTLLKSYAPLETSALGSGNT